MFLSPRFATPPTYTFELLLIVNESLNVTLASETNVPASKFVAALVPLLINFTLID